MFVAHLVLGYLTHPFMLLEIGMVALMAWSLRNRFWGSGNALTDRLA